MSKKWGKKPQRRPELRAESYPTSLRSSGASAGFALQPDVAGAGDKPLTPFTMIAYTGVPMRLPGFKFPVIFDLASAHAPQQSVPVPISHDPERIAGHTTSIEITPTEVRASGVLSGENEHSADVVRKARNKFPWQASIGGEPAPGTPNAYQFVRDGESATVNGRLWQGPLVIARHVVIREISITPMGADGSTAANIAASYGNGVHEMTYEQWLIARGITGALTPQETAYLRACWQAESANPATPADAPALLAAFRAAAPPITARTPAELGAEIAAELQANRTQAAAERARQREIDAVCAANPALETEITVGGAKKKVNILEHAITAGWTAADAAREFELATLRASRAVVPGGLGYVVNAPEANDAVMEAAILQATRCRLFDNDFYQDADGSRRVPERVQRETQRELAARYTDQVQQAAHTMFRGGIGLQQVLHAAAVQGGYRGPEVIRDDGTLTAMLRAAFRPGLRAESSTISIANITSNVQNKYLLQGYMFTEMTWRAICGIKSVKDFKATKSINLLSDTTFLEVSDDGEIKHAKLNDQAFANQAKTYGRMLIIPRKLIINDDISALSQVPMALGRGYGLKMNSLFWTLFLSPGKDDGGESAGTTNFFAATHTLTGGQTGNSNLSTGAGSALGGAGLTAAVLLFDNQIDPVGLPIGLDASILLYGPDLETTALELMQSERVVSGNTTKGPDKNVWRNRFTPHKSRYINKSAFTGYSTTAWWLLADPGLLPVIEVCFLNGQEQPQVQSAEADFDTLGIQTRAFFDAGVTMQNFRGGVKSDGA